MSTDAATADLSWQTPINILSGVICLVVAVLILGPRPPGVAGAIDVSALPAVNASLNACTTLILIAGFTAIRLRRITLHKRLMISAFVLSAAFLVTYVIYHTFSAGPAVYEGAYRGLYFFILFTHIPLAAIILPFALTTLARGWLGAIARHRRIAPWTLALWLYVSVTGVAIYWMAHG
jgi:putative membrane protein